MNNKALAKGDELFYFRKEKSSASSSDYVDKKGEKRKFDSKFAERDRWSLLGLDVCGLYS